MLQNHTNCKYQQKRNKRHIQICAVRSVFHIIFASAYIQTGVNSCFSASQFSQGEFCSHCWPVLSWVYYFLWKSLKSDYNFINSNTQKTTILNLHMKWRSYWYFMIMWLVLKWHYDTDKLRNDTKGLNGSEFYHYSFKFLSKEEKIYKHQ